MIGEDFCSWFWTALVLYCINGQNCPYDSPLQSGCVESKFQPYLMGFGVHISSSDQYPYIVSLQTLISSNNHLAGNECYKHFCGGTMIAPNLILTAAHCFDKLKSWYPRDTMSGQQYYVPIENIYAAISPQCRHLSNKKYGRMLVNSIFIHPQYQQKEVPENDVAILEVLGKEGQFYGGPLVKLVSATMRVDAQIATAIGYGEAQPMHIDKYIASPLQEANQTFINYETCKNFLGMEDDASSTQLDYSSMVCYFNRNATACGGDSGGPLLDNNGFQFALVSWGPGGSTCKVFQQYQPPVVYVRLTLFMDWIQLIMQFFSVVSSEQDPVQQQEAMFSIQQQEANALLTFANSMRENSNLSSWRGTDACNNWLGISCFNNRVIEILLGETITWNLDDIFKNEVRTTPLVENIQTSIPDQWTVLEKLQIISLEGTGLTGVLPAWLSQMKDLNVLSVDQGKLQGTLPHEFSTLSSLSVFYAKETGLKGPLPVQYSTLASLQYISLYKNNLTGPLPVQYSTLVSLKYMSLWKNNLTGTLPQQYSKFVNLYSLYLERNELRGSVPPQYVNLGPTPYIILFPQKGDLLCLDKEHKSIVNDSTDVIVYC